MKLVFWSRLLCIMLVIPVILSGCGLAGRGNTPPPAVTRIKIGVALYKQDDTFISTMFSSFQAAAKALEAQKGITITLNAVDGKGSQTLQNEQVDRFLVQDYDVICVNMVDRTAASVIIDKAKNANIPVVFFNREPVEEDMQRWSQLYYVGADAKQSGVMQGQLVIDCYNNNPDAIDKNGDGKLQYVMLEGEPGHQDALLRTEYAIKTVAAAGIKIEKLANDTANWQRGQATTKMAQWIESFGNQIEVVFSNNDDMALGAIDAFKAAGIEEMPPVFGVDATPPAVEAVRAGHLTGTVFNDGKNQAKVMLDLCYALALHQDAETSVPLVEDKYVWVPYAPVTPKTLETSVPEA